MITLGIDTSGKTLSVALAKEEEILAEYSLALGYKHSVTFQPAIDMLLKASGLTLRDVNLFALAVGPGSFTGIRIGLAAVKAMAYATGAGTMAVSSLRALARSAGSGTGLILPVLDARGGRVYSTLLRDGLPLADEIPRDLQTLVTDLFPLVREGEEVFVTGDGIPVIKNLLDQTLPFKFLFSPPTSSLIRASAVIELALEDLALGAEMTDPFQLEARYGLASSAERFRLGEKS